MAEEVPKPGKSVERLFPFAVRARLLLVGRETLAHSKRKLQCILISEDISDGSRDEILQDFKDYPVLQHFTTLQFESFFGLRNTKVIGLKKSSLAKHQEIEVFDQFRHLLFCPVLLIRAGLRFVQAKLF